MLRLLCYCIAWSSLLLWDLLHEGWNHLAIKPGSKKLKIWFLSNIVPFVFFVRCSSRVEKCSYRKRSLIPATLRLPKNLWFSKNTCLVAGFSNWHESGPHYQEQVGWGTWLLLSRLLTFVFPASGQQDVQKLTLTKVRWSIYQDRGSWLQSIWVLTDGAVKSHPPFQS